MKIETRPVLEKPQPVPALDPTKIDSYIPGPKRDVILTTREATHGPFNETARIAQEIKATITQASGWIALNPAQREALDMIASKIGRVLSGDPKHEDHWVDIAGYAKLGQEACKP